MIGLAAVVVDLQDKPAADRSGQAGGRASGRAGGRAGGEIPSTRPQPRDTYPQIKLFPTVNPASQ